MKFENSILVHLFVAPNPKWQPTDHHWPLVLIIGATLATHLALSVSLELLAQMSWPPPARLEWNLENELMNI